MSTTPDPLAIVTVGYDGSETAAAAVRWAAAEAVARRGRLRIVTAWDPSPISPWSLPHAEEWRSQARQAADQEANNAHAITHDLVETEAVAVEGAAGQVLVNESHRADLLVVSSAGHIGLAGFLSGSVSRQCLRRASSPVVVLGPEARPDPVQRLVLSSTLDPDRETFAWVDDWLGYHPVPIHVIASFDFTAEVPELQLSDVQRQVRSSVREQNDHWVARLRDVVAGRAEVSKELLEGQTLDVLRACSQAGDLIVVPSGSEHSVPLADGTSPIAMTPSPRHVRSHASAVISVSEAPPVRARL
jgi:nucleotide-binding universal stress UspA family protein